MDLTGTLWGPDGAEAVLRLRSLRASDQADSDDVPVLTDVVLPILCARLACTSRIRRRCENRDQLAAALRVVLAADIAEAIDWQLASDLPEILEATLFAATDRMR